MTPGNWVILGWFFGVPASLLALWVFEVGPARHWNWDIVLAPWPIGLCVLWTLWMMGAFDKRNETSEGNH